MDENSTRQNQHRTITVKSNVHHPLHLSHPPEATKMAPVVQKLINIRGKQCGCWPGGYMVQSTITDQN
jgi:hypothetical protein